MAETEAGKLLTRHHRERQLAVKAATMRDLLALWPAFRLDDIDRTWQPLEVAVLAVIANRRRASAGFAASYYRAFRAAEGVEGEPVVRIAEPPARGLLIGALRLAGPIGTKKTLLTGASNPLDRAFSRVAGTATRQVLDGGRKTLTESVRADRAARGWQRITSGKACSFCSMLASRGAVYSEDTVGFESHDHCSCTAEPVYR
jgi:hypothetical protein